MKELLAVRGLSALLAWTFATCTLAFGLWNARGQFASETTAAHQYWGEATVGLVTATSGYNGSITTAIVEYTSPRSATYEEVTRIMGVANQPGTRPMIWEGTDGKVFVQGAVTGNRYVPLHVEPWPSPLQIYVMWLVIACVFALPSFIIGASIGYLMSHRGQAPSS